MGKLRKLVAAAAVAGALSFLPISSVTSQDAAGGVGASVVQAGTGVSMNGGQGDWPLRR